MNWKENFAQCQLEIELDERKTICNILCGGKFSYPFDWIRQLTSNNFRYCVYLSLLATTQIVQYLANGVYALSITLAICTTELVVLIIILFECNLFIFQQSLKTFGVYCKTVNILIAMIAYHIDYNFFDTYYDFDNLPLLYLIGIVAIFKNTLAMFIISIIDGYCVDKRVCIFVISIYLLYFCYTYYYVINFECASLDKVGSIFNCSFHWHTIATTCMNSAIIFLLSQVYSHIRKPSKLVFIPSLIVFKITQRKSKINRIIQDMNCEDCVYTLSESQSTVNYDYDININNGCLESTPYKLCINKQDTLYNWIFGCNHNRNKVTKCLFSSYVHGFNVF